MVGGVEWGETRSLRWIRFPDRSQRKRQLGLVVVVVVVGGG